MEFMQGIGGAVTTYEVDIEASRKIADIREVMNLIKETINSCFSGDTPEYDKGVLDTIKTIEEIIEK